MRTSRLVVAVLCSIVFGLSALVVNSRTLTGVAHGIQDVEGTPSPVASPSTAGFFPTEPKMIGREPLYESVIGTPGPDDPRQVLSVMPISIGENEGFGLHEHLGASILVVESGSICIAQLFLNLSDGDAEASVTVVRKEAATSLTESVCTAPDGTTIKPACPDDDADHGCTFVPCPDTCSIGANEMFWLGPGDKVVQSHSTRHAMLNVGGAGESAELINTVVITTNPGSGCAGDCV